MGQGLSSNGQLMADAIATRHADESIIAVVSDEHSAEAAAAAIICGRDRFGPAVPALQTQLDQDGLRGRTAAWALGQLGAAAELLAAAGDGGLDRRENAYFGLACLVAAEQQPANLGDAIVARIDDELARAQAGRSGLCEHASRILVMLADPRSEQRIQAIIEGDPLTDRFELQRQRKALADHGRDQESLQQLADWHSAFAEDIAQTVEAEASSEPAPTPSTPLQSPDAPENATDDSIDPADESADPAAEAESQALPLDVQAYIESLGDNAAEDPMLGLLPQVLPMFKQLAQQAVGAQLEDLSGEEFAALVLQVLPQALPPQYLQALFNPQAINALAGLFKWYEQQGGNSGLAQGIAIVRQQLQEQVRSSGVLGGPDFTDPDAAEPS